MACCDTNLYFDCKECCTPTEVFPSVKELSDAAKADKSWISTLIVLLVGFLFPPLWLINLKDRSNSNKLARLFYDISMTFFWLVFLVLFLAAWAAVITLTVFTVQTGTSNGQPVYEQKYYNAVVKNVKLFPGEMYAILWTPVIFLVVFSEFLLRDVLEPLILRLKALKQNGPMS